MLIANELDNFLSQFLNLIFIFLILEFSFHKLENFGISVSYVDAINEAQLLSYAAR